MTTDGLLTTLVSFNDANGADPHGEDWSWAVTAISTARPRMADLAAGARFSAGHLGVHQRGQTAERKRVAHRHRAGQWRLSSLDQRRFVVAVRILGALDERVLRQQRKLLLHGRGRGHQPVTFLSAFRSLTEVTLFANWFPFFTTHLTL